MARALDDALTRWIASAGLALISCGTEPPTSDGDGSTSAPGSSSTSEPGTSSAGDSESATTGASEPGDTTAVGTSSDDGDGSSTGDTFACEILSATGASALGDDGNVPANVLDDDLDTRWSCQGVGCWVEIELPEMLVTSALSVAWYRGDERRSAFGVDISSDGETYTEVFRGWSAGDSIEPETYGFGADAEARFVRLTFFGSTMSDWASVLELRALGSGCEPWMQEIYLAIGQSNMAGRAPIEDEDRPAPPGVYVLDGDAHWEPASNEPMGLNRHSSVEEPMASRTRLGPAYAFGRELAASTGQRVGLVVNARGGTTISQWAKEGFEGDYPLYAEAVSRTQAALAANPGARLRGVIWHQGEGDNNPTSAETYVDDLAMIVANLRDDLDAPDAFFIAGEVGTWQGRGMYVNPEIHKVPDVIPHAAWVSSEGLTTHETATDPWGPHFDSASQRIFGKRYADAMRTR